MIPINEFKGAYCFCIYFVIRSFLKTSYHLIFDLELCVRVKPILKYRATYCFRSQPVES